MSNSIAPGSSADVNVRITTLTTNLNVPVTYKTIILKKNLVDGVNTLTQTMFTQSNVKYVIKYDFTLGEDITIPTDCILSFDGGTIVGNSNHLIHQNLYISADTGFSCFIDCYPEPKTARTYFIKNDNIYVDWFKSVNDTTYDNTPSFNLAFTCAWKNRDWHTCVTLKFNPHPYYLTNIAIEGDAAKFTPVFDFNNATIYPVGNNLDCFISIKNNGEYVTTSRNFHFSNGIFYIDDSHTTHSYTDFIKVGEDSVYTVNNVLIDNCIFDGIICTNAIIENFMGYGLTIRHCRISNIVNGCHYGIYCHHGETVGGKYYHTYDLNILDCDISSHLQVGISIGAGSIGIRDSVIEGNGTGVEIREQNSGNLTAVIDNVYFEQNTDCHVFIGRFLESPVNTSGKGQDLLITGCKFDTDANSGPAIKVQPYASACIIGNMFVGAKGAIQSYISVDNSLPTKIYTYGNKIPTIEGGNITGFSKKQILADALLGEYDLTSKDYKFIIASGSTKYYKLVMPYNNYVNLRMLLTNNTAASYAAFRCENTTTGYKVCGNITQSLPKIGDDNNIYIALTAWDRFYIDSNDSLAKFEEIDADTYNAQTLRDFSN